MGFGFAAGSGRLCTVFKVSASRIRMRPACLANSPASRPELQATEGWFELPSSEAGDPKGALTERGLWRDVLALLADMRSAQMSPSCKILESWSLKIKRLPGLRAGLERASVEIRGGRHSSGWWAGLFMLAGDFIGLAGFACFALLDATQIHIESCSTWCKARLTVSFVSPMPSTSPHCLARQLYRCQRILSKAAGPWRLRCPYRYLWPGRAPLGSQFQKCSKCSTVSGVCPGVW